MKRIRIWLSNFSLIQQFLAIVFLVLASSVIFIFGFLNNNIDSFVDMQMYSYLHREQNEFLQTRKLKQDSNADSYIYSIDNNKYLSSIDGEYKDMIALIDINSVVDSIDSSFEYNDMNVVYSIITFDDHYRLLSIVKNDYILEFRNALISTVVNVTFYMVGAIICIVLIWVVSLIRPLNQIKTYINKLKLGEKADLYIGRNDEIGAVGEALTDMNIELNKQQRIRDEMIQNISHDLKTPIATIKSYSESIIDGIYPYDTLEKSVNVISENASRLEKKVYSLITYNKLGYLVDKDPGILNLNMAPVIQKAILAAQVLRSDFSIETDVDDTVMFHGEEEPWRVVVENLIDNGLRYAKTTLKITLNNNMLEVYNDGPTMDKDRIEKLFKPYEKGTNGKFGLGLSIVKKVCDTYGYTVTGDNMSDGVVFRVYTTSKFKKPSNKKNKKGII